LTSITSVSMQRRHPGDDDTLCLRYCARHGLIPTISQLLPEPLTRSCKKRSNVVTQKARTIYRKVPNYESPYIKISGNPTRDRYYQPCLCLCLGFSQMIRIEPLRLMTLHFSQIGFTEDLTFIVTLLSHQMQKTHLGFLPDTFNNNVPAIWSVWA